MLWDLTEGKRLYSHPPTPTHTLLLPPLPQDGVAMLWDLTEGKRLYSLDAGDIIYSLVFSPNRYWLCAATQSAIKIWDLESKVGGGGGRVRVWRGKGV